MKQERIEYFEALLKRPMAEPHRSWIEELLQAVKPGQPSHAKPAKAKPAPVIEAPEEQDAISEL